MNGDGIKVDLIETELAAPQPEPFWSDGSLPRSAPTRLTGAPFLLATSRPGWSKCGGRLTYQRRVQHGAGLRYLGCRPGHPDFQITGRRQRRPEVSIPREAPTAPLQTSEMPSAAPLIEVSVASSVAEAQPEKHNPRPIRLIGDRVSKRGAVMTVCSGPLDQGIAQQCHHGQGHHLWKCDQTSQHEQPVCFPGENYILEDSLTKTLLPWQGGAFSVEPGRWSADGLKEGHRRSHYGPDPMYWGFGGNLWTCHRLSATSAKDQ